MSKKTQKEKQAEAEFKHKKFIFAGKIKDSYPEVKELIFEFYFEDPDKLAKPSNKKFNREKEGSALFEFDCPYWECVGGGFDLSQPISNMIKYKNNECNGQIFCQGWQDRERINKYHCLCQLTYKITAKYE